MAVFEYTATSPNREDSHERGVIVARDKIDAYDKLRRNNMTPISLKKLEGLQAFLGRRTADIR